MQCEICERCIKKGYTIDEVMDKIPQHICSYCYLKYPLIERTSTLPIDGGMLTVIGLNPPILHKPFAYMTFYRPYLLGYIQYNHHDNILLFDILDTSVYTLLDTLRLGSMYVLTLYLSID